MKLIYLICCIVIFYSGKAQTTVTIYPNTGTYCSGYVSSTGTKYNGNIQLSNGSILRRGWANFPLTAIPQNASISSISIIFYSYSGTELNATNTITGFIGDPITMNGNDLYNSIGTGNVFNSSSWSIGTSTNPSLNSKSLTASAFVQQQLSVGHVNFGFIRGATDIYSIYGFSSTNYKVRLEITYTTCQNSFNSGWIIPDNATFSTGYVKSTGVKYSGNLLVSLTSTYGRGWARFPLNSIPSNATITSANVRFYTYDGVSSATSNTIKGFTGNPITMTGSTLYSTIDNGTSLNNSSWSMGTIQNPAQNTKSLSNISFIQSQLSSGYLNLGFIRNVFNLYSIYGSNNSNYTIAIELNYTLPSSASISPVGPVNFCSGGSVSLNANTGNNLSYQWFKDGVPISGANSASYLSNSSGNYAALITNSAGCTVTSNSIQVTVNNLPNPLISGASSFCQGNTTTLFVTSNPGDTFQWKKNGVNLTGETNSTLIVSTAGFYSVLSTNTSGCSSISPSFNVTLSSTPNSSINALNPTTFCSGGGVNLSAPISTPGYIYQWYSNGNLILGANSNIYFATTSGTYKVLITNASGCSNFSNNSIVVNCLPQPTLNISGDTSICYGESTVLAANSNSFNIVWNGNQNQSTILVTPNVTTEYNVEAIGSNGCSNSETVTVVVHYASDTTIYLSSYGPLNMGGQIFDESGVYILDLNSIYGCDSIVTLNLNVYFNGIDEQIQDDIRVTNPVQNGQVVIFTQDALDLEIIGIYNLLGSEVKFQFVESTNDSTILKFEEFSGLYMISIKKGNKLINKPFVVAP